VRATFAAEEGYRGITAVDHERLVAKLAHHVVKEPALHRIVVDDQNTLTHDATSHQYNRVPIWGTVAELG
jgi:hypothetical protein